MILRGALSMAPTLINHQSKAGLTMLNCIGIRLKSAKKIQIISQSMNMASAANCTRLGEIKLPKPCTSLPGAFQSKFEVGTQRRGNYITANQEKAGNNPVIAITRDRSMCAAIQSSVALNVAATEAQDSDNSLKFMTIEEVTKPEVTGAIIPFSEMNFFQEFFFFYQYPIMYYLDFLLNFMPWWAAIAGMTATIRILCFPLVLKMNIIGIKTSNIMPETQRIQVKINEAMCSGDHYATALQRAKLKALYAANGVSLMDRLWPTLIQTPAYVCLFFTLKNLATYYKIDSMTTGGVLWFANLTIPDPFYVLPIITCTSMFLLMNYGIEGSSGPMTQMGPLGRWFIRLLPVGLFALIHSFPAAVLLFWTTNNCFTLSFALLFKNSWVKRKLNIPKRIEHPASALPITNQTFTSQIKGAYESGKSNRTSMDVRRLDDIAFRKAGVEPLRKTYKTSPSEQRE